MGKERLEHGSPGKPGLPGNPGTSRRGGTGGEGGEGGEGGVTGGAGGRGGVGGAMGLERTFEIPSRFYWIWAISYGILVLGILALIWGLREEGIQRTEDTRRLSLANDRVAES